MRTSSGADRRLWGRSPSCRPEFRPAGAGTGPRVHSMSTWNRAWSRGSLPRRSASTRREACCPRSTPWTYPQLVTAMRAVDAELTAGGVGGSLAAESLANVLAVHLIRHLVAPGRAVHGRDGTLPQGRLRAVVEYIEEHLDAGPTLAEIAAVAGLNPYHFARQFKAATGLAAPPVRDHAPRRASQAPPASRDRLVPGRGRSARRLLRPEPILPPLQAARRRHARSVPDALKNRLKDASLAKRPGGKASIIQSDRVESRQ